MSLNNSGSMNIQVGNTARNINSFIYNVEKKRKKESELFGKKCGIPSDIENVIGREKDVTQIFNSLLENTIALVTGMAGVGKTLTSLKIVHQYVPDTFQIAAMINMENKSTMEKSIRGFLKLIDVEWNDIMLENIKNMYSFFETSTCLLILDNIVETNEDLKNFIREVKNDKIFILGTSQDKNLCFFPWIYNLNLLTEEQSEELLGIELTDLGDKFKVENAPDIRVLVNKLEFNPLAIKSAGAFIALMNDRKEGRKNDGEDYSVKRYLNDYQSNFHKIPEKCKSYYTKSVYASVVMNIDKLKRKNRDAYEILCYLSFLEPSGIRKRMFSDQPNIELTLKILKRYNIIQIYESTDIFINIHRLFRDIVQNLLKRTPNEFDFYKKNIVETVLMFSETETDIEIHFDSILQNFNESDLETIYLEIMRRDYFKTKLQNVLNTISQAMLGSQRNNNKCMNLINKIIFGTTFVELTSKNWRALHFACFFGHSAIIQKFHTLKIPFHCPYTNWSVLESVVLTSKFSDYLFNQKVVQELKLIPDKLQRNALQIFKYKTIYMEHVEARVKITELLLKCLDDTRELKKFYKKLIIAYKSLIDSDLLQAAEDGCAEIIKLFVDAKHDLNVKDDNGDTPLHIAIYFKKLESVRILIDAGADVSFKDNDDWTPFHLLIQYGHLDIIKNIIELKRNNVVEGFSLLNSLLDLNLSNGTTVFHFVAYFGKLDIVKYFVMLISESEQWNSAATATKLYIEQKTTDFRTPFFLAVSEGHLDIVKYIVELVRTNYLEESSLLNLFLTSKSSVGWTVLHFAAFNGRLNIIEYFVKFASEINNWYSATTAKILYIQTKNHESWTPLHFAVNNGHLDIVKYIIQLLRSNHLEQPLKLLLKMKLSGGLTVFHLAAGKGRLNIVEYFVTLISETEKLNSATTATKLYIQTKDNELWAPIHAAVQEGHLDIVKYIVQLLRTNDLELSLLKLFLELKPFGGWTVLHIAARNGRLNIIEYFVTLISELEKWNSATTAMKLYIEPKDNISWTPFHSAVQKGHLDIIKCIIQLLRTNDLEEFSLLKLLLEMKLPDGLTVFHIAADKGRLNIVEYFVTLISETEKWNSVATATKLFIQTKDKYSRSPLHASVQAGNLDIVKYIVQFLRENDRNEEFTLFKLLLEQKIQGYTIFQIALRSGRSDIVAYFVELLSVEKINHVTFTKVKSLLIENNSSKYMLFDLAKQSKDINIVNLLSSLYESFDLSVPNLSSDDNSTL